jgi:hypothetical protein
MPPMMSVTKSKVVIDAASGELGLNGELIICKEFSLRLDHFCSCLWNLDFHLTLPGQKQHRRDDPGVKTICRTNDVKMRRKPSFAFAG